MRRIAGWGVGLGLASLLGMAALRGQQEGSPAAATPGSTPKDEAVVFTFPDAASTQRFVGLSEQRKGILLRSAVLEAYLKEEQAAIDELQGRLSSEFKLDPTRSYTLDRTRLVVMDAQSGAGVQRIMHTFADEDELQAFVSILEQLQGLRLRRDVLRAYWDDEQARLRQVYEVLRADYQIDPSKDYILDEQRHALIEQGATTPATTAPTQP